MKTKKKCMLFTVTIMLLITAGCDKSDNVNINPGFTAPDPKGTITIDITSESTSVGVCEIFWEEPNTIHVVNEAQTNYEVVNAGTMNGLGNVKTNFIPEKGWAQSILCKPKCGYIVRQQTGASSLENSRIYSAFYVTKNLEDADGNIIGAEIKYCLYTPNKGWLE